MDQQEFMFLIPGVIYGIAIFDLLSIIRSNKIYWESLLWVLLLFFCIVSILFNLFPKLEAITSNIRIYTLFLFSPILFAHSCFLLTPKEENSDLKHQFHQNRKAFFLSASGVITVGLILNYIGIKSSMIYLNIIGLSLFLLNVFIDKLPLRLAAAVFLLVWIILNYMK